MGYPLWKISIFSPLTNRHFYCLEWLFYQIEHCKTLSLTCFPKREIISKFPIFDKNHGLAPLENFDFFIINKSTFLSSRMAFFHQIEYRKTLSLTSFPKREIISTFQILDKNHRLTPLGIFNILPLKNRHWYRLEWPFTK